MYPLKHKDEWPVIINTANKHGLTEEQTIFLLALREVEDGGKDTEFNIRSVHGFADQINKAIASIKANEKRWQDYIRDQSYMDYVKFFALLGGPMKTGWHTKAPRSPWINKMERVTERIRDEFETDSGMGK